MAIKMVRQPSETPNINNVDDIVGLRYSYGNQNGYVIGKGNEVSHSVNGSTFTINSGRLVLQGVEVDIDANGLDLTVDNIATKQYYSVYLTVNLALNTVQIQFTVDTTGYPERNPGDDLTKNTSGIARLELYRFTAQNGVISEVSKLVQAIKYIEDRTVANARKINNLEMMYDDNGVLKIGNIIIPQKKLLWEGDVTSDGGDIILNEALKLGDTIEVWWEFSINRPNMHHTKGVVSTQNTINGIMTLDFEPVAVGLNDGKYTDEANNWITLNCYLKENGTTIECSSNFISRSRSYTEQLSQGCYYRFFKIYKIIE